MQVILLGTLYLDISLQTDHFKVAPLNLRWHDQLRFPFAPCIATLHGRHFSWLDSWCTCTSCASHLCSYSANLDLDIIDTTEFLRVPGHLKRTDLAPKDVLMVALDEV